VVWLHNHQIHTVPINSSTYLDALTADQLEMATEVAADQIQARTQAARREAETLKERIRRKKEELADTTREFPLVPFDLSMASACTSALNGDDEQAPSSVLRSLPRHPLARVNMVGANVADIRLVRWYSAAIGSRTLGTAEQDRNENSADVERPPGQDICDALVDGPEALGFGLAGWQADYLGRVHD
jgi:hypothetical protein